MADGPEPPESDNKINWRRRIWDITNHGMVAQVLGGLIVIAITAIITTILATSFNRGDAETPAPEASTPSQATTSVRSQAPSSFPTESTGGSAGSPSPPDTFTGRLVIGKIRDKDIDTNPPSNLHWDSDADIGYGTNDGPALLNPEFGNPSIARYKGVGNPTRSTCDQTAQAEGTSRAEVTKGTWICVRTEYGTVMAFKVTKVTNDSVEGEATIWYPE